ncbi:MAG: PD40 domain-containing protein [Kiritimatiellae bacterium]|nr:PD40 domain-containing protein [Kiritimatiellia bacterium]
MINSWIGRMLLVPLAIGTAGGCDSTPARARAAADPVPLAAPPELAGARLLYQRPDGIYLRVLGQAQATRLAADGTWPRWSPDGKSFAFVRGPRILHCDLETRKERVLAEASHARAVAFHPDGQRVLFTDGKSVKSVPVAGGSATTLVTGPAFLELDVSSTGDFLVTTVKSRGYRVWRFDLPAGRKTEIGRGCSAGISPDDRLVTVNLDGHDQLALRDSRTGEERGRVPAPAGLRLDNQQWSNRPEWIMTVREGPRRDILAQRVADGRVWRLTDDGDADRPDLFVD